MRRSFGLAALFAALFLVGQIPASLIKGTTGVFVSAAMSVALPYAAFRLQKNTEPLSEYRIDFYHRDSLPWLSAVFPFVLLTMGVAALSSYFFSFFGISDSYVISSPLLLCLITDALLPAICEEFVCRKLILGTLLRYNRRGAVICSALIFSLMHAKAIQLPYTFFAGLLLAAVTAASGSLLPAFVMHFANNACSLLSQFYGAPLTSVMYPVLVALSVLSLVILIIRKKELKSLRNVLFDRASSFSMYGTMITSPASLFILVMLFLTFFGG